MDFARKQLEKYGWSDGKGLGKNENGISEALKPKLKRSVAGIGYDAAQDFTEHWWSALYDKAASNLEVEEKNGKTKKIKHKDDEFEITNSTWKLKKKTKDKNEKEYSEFFIKTAVIDTGGTKSTKTRDSDSDDNDNNKTVVTMTDEELFAACQGRTAHKGARHGLRALGKLARIEEQEKILLQQTKYEGYSHSKKIKNRDIEAVFENTSLNSDAETTITKKKKKKHCGTKDNGCIEGVNEKDNVAIKSKTKSKTKRDCITYMECENSVSEVVIDHDMVEQPKSKAAIKRKDCMSESSNDFDNGKDCENKTNEGRIKSREAVADEFDAEETLKPKQKKKKQKHYEGH